MWDSTGKNNMEHYLAKVRGNPGLQSVKAVRNNRLAMVPDRYQSCSSQYIVAGIRGIARAAYPQLAITLSSE
jgi:iron complex transport system substrate-binding protein